MTTTARTTGIGSLPHHNTDAALHFSFQMGIPFLPQIPIRNPSELLIAQALEGLPGLILEEGGLASLNETTWKTETPLLRQRLLEALNHSDFKPFEPSGAASSCWQPFLWELQERGTSSAKIQIAGPLTCQWALKIQDGSTPDRHPELSSQIFQLVLVRSIAMVKRIRSFDIQPILYLDEPGLFALSLKNPKHLLALQELKLFVQTLRKEGALVGLHCCSDTAWEAVFGLNIDLLSIDTALSLAPALDCEQGEAMARFIRQGGRLSLGVIPTSRHQSGSPRGPIHGPVIVAEILGIFRRYWESRPDLVKKVIQEAIYTPACGLAFRSTSEADSILGKLMEVYELFDSERF